MRKIAILKVSDNYQRYEDDTLLIEKVTDFQIVDDETYNLLVAARNDYTLGFRFDIIEVPMDQQKFIMDTVDQYKAAVEKVRLEQKALREKAEKQKAANKAKQKAEQEAKEKKLLAELAKKHGLPQL